MTQRYYIYPILFITLMQLAPLLRGDRRWYAAQIAQLVFGRKGIHRRVAPRAFDDAAHHRVQPLWRW